MKRSFALLTALVLLFALNLSAYAEPSATPGATPESGAVTKAVIYYPNQDASALESEIVELVLSPDALLSELSRHEGALPEGTRALSFEKGALDLSAEFKEGLSAAGTAGEWGYIASLADTFLTNYALKELKLTCEGKPVDTGHASYDKPIEFMENEGGALPKLAQGAQLNTLKRGDRGALVVYLQRALKSLGYLYGGVDGVYGTQTYNAVRRLQITLDLAQTGSADGALQQKLYGGEAGSFNRYVGFSKGKKGVRVEDMQRRLIELGYPSVELNGRYDDHTDVAVRLFQGDHGFKEQGKITSEQLRKLYATQDKYQRYVKLSKGDSGQRVLTLQKRLKKLGYMSGSIKGNYGTKTYSAVKAFQKQVGLKSTGTADVKTLKKLFSKKAPHYAEPTPPPTGAPTPAPVPTPAPAPTPEPTAA